MNTHYVRLSLILNICLTFQRSNMFNTTLKNNNNEKRLYNSRNDHSMWTDSETCDINTRNSDYYCDTNSCSNNNSCSTYDEQEYQILAELKYILCDSNKRLLNFVKEKETDIKKLVQNSVDSLRGLINDYTPNCSDTYLEPILEQMRNDKCGLSAESIRNLRDIQVRSQLQVIHDISRNINNGLSFIENGIKDKSYSEMVYIIKNNLFYNSVVDDFIDLRSLIFDEFDRMGEKQKIILLKEASTCPKLEAYIKMIDEGVSSSQECQYKYVNTYSIHFVNNAKTIVSDIDQYELNNRRYVYDMEYKLESIIMGILFDDVNS